MSENWISPCEEIGIKREVEKLRNQIEVLSDDAFKNEIVVQEFKEELICKVNKYLERMGK